ncbi:MAG: S-ribosylhomocysteine lyase [Clostridia bacterium]|nr:S-ribosylhomocysteine lyase [Clostridia bacterium]
MEKIKSFTIDHMTLLPGVYVSRADSTPSGEAITTYDIRLTRPNFEKVMSTGEAHTIEHLGATYLRNREDYKSRVIYWGPMGCRTGFYLIMAGELPVDEIVSLMEDTFRFIAGFNGAVPGASPVECGNYSDMDLPAAKARAWKYLDILKKHAF